MKEHVDTVEDNRIEVMRRLCAAILCQAIEDAIGQPKETGGGKREARVVSKNATTSTAREWIFGKSDTNDGGYETFLLVCDVLDRDPSYVRRKVKELDELSYADRKKITWNKGALSINKEKKTKEVLINEPEFKKDIDAAFMKRYPNSFDSYITSWVFCQKQRKSAYAKKIRERMLSNEKITRVG